jgi:hypothetical protein
MNLNKLKFSILVIPLLFGLAACGAGENTIPDEANDSSNGGAANENINAQPGVDGTAYWITEQDSEFGFGFAVPCFWGIEESFQKSSGGIGYYNLTNYSDQFRETFPRGEGVFEAGGEKINIEVIDITTSGYPFDTSLEDYTAQAFNTDYSEVRDVEEVTYNGQTGILLTTYYFENENLGQGYYFSLGDGLVLHFSAFGFAGYDAPDVQAILGSFAFTSDIDIQVPNKMPSPPPVGMTAPCIPEYIEPSQPEVQLSEHNTICGRDSFNSLDYLVTNVEAYLQDRNTGGLRWDYFIHEPIEIGYWQSEGQTLTPDAFANLLANSLYNPVTPGTMTFTTDRAEFPFLDGTPPEDFVNPELTVAEIVYSEGWGQNNGNAALLFFTEDECGGYYWQGLLYANGHFDQ